MTNPPSLSQVYDAYLGGVLAMSPELYREALDAIAARLGRENDEVFRAEVQAYEKTLPCHLD